jgi:hypothetical protein
MYGQSQLTTATLEQKWLKIAVDNGVLVILIVARLGTATWRCFNLLTVKSYGAERFGQQSL